MATDANKQKAEQAEKDRLAAEQAEKDKAAAEQAEKDRIAAEEAEKVNTANQTAATDPEGTADKATEGGAEQRLANSTNAEQGQDEGRALTQLQAMQQSALEARRTGDAVVSPKSQTITNPDAEMRAELTNDALTASREALSRQVGEIPDAEELVRLFDKVTEAQGKVDAAINERDAARDAYDRAAEASALGNAQTHESTIGSYLEAQNKLREKQARQQAD